ncbi:putative periplasmic serine endoprotease DegP-like [Gammaproteobacteria bacterium]
MRRIWMILQRLLSILFTLLFTLPAWAGGQHADFTAVIEQASRAVVNISTVQRASAPNKKSGVFNSIPPELRDFLDRFLERPPTLQEEQQARALGSGFIISPDGYILTAAHVVKDADVIVVRDTNRREWTAKVVGADSLIDVALLKVNATDLPIARIGNSDTLKVGQWVLAIGQPFGLDYTATSGIVSALGRSLPNDTYVPFIQTDVAVNPGSSGGPLYSMNGAVVGINSQIYSPSGGYAGLSFAIPINVAIEAAEQLKTRGRIMRGWLGITIQRVSQDLANSFGLDRPHGALVSRIDPESPAQAAGLQTGDILVAYDGHAIDTAADLPPLVGRTHPGVKVPVTILRNAKEQTLTIDVVELPREMAERRVTKPKIGRSRKTPEPPPLLGLTVTDLPASDHEGPHGVMVKRVEEGPARAAGIHSHDIIARIGGVAVRDTKHFRTLIPKLPRGQTVPILVLREGNPMFLALRIP